MNIRASSVSSFNFSPLFFLNSVEQKKKKRQTLVRTNGRFVTSFKHLIFDRSCEGSVMHSNVQPFQNKQDVIVARTQEGKLS